MIPDGLYNIRNIKQETRILTEDNNPDRFYINGKLTQKKNPNTDEHICTKCGLIRDLISYSIHEK